MSKLQTIELHNFQGLSDINLEPYGRHVYAIAGNAKGKSSFIRAIMGIISNTDMPPEILKQGHKQGGVSMVFPQCTVTLKFTEKNPKGTLSVVLPDGTNVSSPRKWLTEHVGVINIDPSDFFRLRGKERNSYLYRLLGLDDMKQLDANYEEKYAERTRTNRYLDELETRLIGVYYDPNFVKMDDAMLKAEMLKVQQHNQNVQQCKNVLTNGQMALTELDKEIAHLEARLNLVKGQKLKQADHIDQCNHWLSQPGNQEISAEVITEQMSKIGEHNLNFERNLENKRKLEEMSVAQAEAVLADKRVKEADKARKTRLAQVNTVPGLEFTEDGPYLNGLPLDENQQNTAELYKTFLALSLFGMRDFRIATFDASLIDEENTRKIHEFAHMHDVQLLVELVDRKGGELRLEIKEPNVY